MLSISSAGIPFNTYTQSSGWLFLTLLETEYENNLQNPKIEQFTDSTEAICREKKQMNQVVLVRNTNIGLKAISQNTNAKLSKCIVFTSHRDRHSYRDGIDWVFTFPEGSRQICRVNKLGQFSPL